MTARPIVYGALLGALNVGWAGFLAKLVAVGVVSPWLVWLVPVPLAVGLCILVIVGRDWLAFRRIEKATGCPPIALARPHAPYSLPAMARDHRHRSADLPARADP